MKIRVGYELIYDCPQPTPMILTLNIHYSRASDLVVPDYVTADPPVPITAYRDGFGNWCSRIVAPAGRIRIAGSAIVRDTGAPDEVVASAVQHPVQDLPEELWSFCWAAGIAKLIACPKSPGICSSGHRPAGGAFRRSAISSTVISCSAMNTPVRPGPPGKPTTSPSASAATLRISPSRSAGA